MIFTRTTRTGFLHGYDYVVEPPCGCEYVFIIDDEADAEDRGQPVLAEMHINEACHTCTIQHVESGSWVTINPNRDHYVTQNIRNIWECRFWKQFWQLAYSRGWKLQTAISIRYTLNRTHSSRVKP